MSKMDAVNEHSSFDAELIAALDSGLQPAPGWEGQAACSVDTSVTLDDFHTEGTIPRSVNRVCGGCVVRLSCVLDELNTVDFKNDIASSRGAVPITYKQELFAEYFQRGRVGAKKG